MLRGVVAVGSGYRVAMGTRASGGHVDRVAAVLRSGLRAAYQPVVHLESGAVLGYEALARVPQGAPAAAPLELFAEARATGRSAGALVALLGPDVDEGVADGADVRVARLPSDSPLADEWTVVLVGAHYSGALVARRLGPDEYDFAVTHDRALVIEAGRALLRNVPVGTTSL